MKSFLSVLLTSAVFSFCSAPLLGQSPTSQNVLWYKQPAANWNEALPIGNGRLGAMVYGNPQQEQIQLNEETIWAGEPGNNIEDGKYDSIVKIRQLLFAEKYKDAQDLSNRAFTRQASPGNNYGMQYQTAGSLFIDFTGHDNTADYRRSLDIGTAISTVTHTTNGVHYKQETFASFIDGVILVRLTADKPGSISCTLHMNSPFKTTTAAVQNNQLHFSGITSDVDNKKGRVKFETILQPVLQGGKLTASDTSLQIANATTVTLYISIGTNFKNYKDISGNAGQKAASYLPAAIKKPYEQAKAAHISFYKKYFDRVKLDLGQTNAANQPTDERLKNFKDANDPAFVSLYYQFGRYLLISCSQPGTQPANLQGIWNERLSPPWDSKYTVNINTEMNYWPAEPTGLSELHQPLFKMLKDLSVTGQESARKMYGARGWNMHHNTDLWRITGVVDGGFYGMWPMGGAWLTQHIWQHYLYTGDKAFLKEYYPVLKGAALFYVDVLQDEPTHHWKVVAPSMSPENTYQPSVGISAGTTMDNQLVFDVFSNLMQAATILQTDKAFADTISNLITQLPPMQIGQHAQLQEWLQDWDNPSSHHRHISHLYGLFPSRQLSPYRNPELFEAAKNTLVSRGDQSTGWSMGWKVNWWARLLDGNHAYKLISDQLRLVSGEVQRGEGGGTYPNLFDAHPPFQIDGNFGCTSGITEMLLQSQDGAIDLLPALPDTWKNGSVKGLKARGGFTINMEWKDGKVNRVEVASALGGNCRLRLGGKLKGTGLKEGTGKNTNPFYEAIEIKTPLISPKAKLAGISLPIKQVYDVATQSGKTYVFTAE